MDMDVPQGTQCGIRNGSSGKRKHPDNIKKRKRRVVNGYKNKPGEWPWLVSLQYIP